MRKVVEEAAWGTNSKIGPATDILAAQVCFLLLLVVHQWTVNGDNGAGGHLARSHVEEVSR